MIENKSRISINSLEVQRRIQQTLEYFIDFYGEENYQGYSTELAFISGNSKSNSKVLLELLDLPPSIESQERALLFNPALPTDSAANYIRKSIDNYIGVLHTKLETMTSKEFQAFIEEFLESGQDLLDYLMNSELGSADWIHEYEAALMLRSIYVVQKYLNEEKRKTCERNLPQAYAFIANLENERLALPFLFWTISDDGDHPLSREDFNTNFNSADEDSHVWVDENFIHSLCVPPSVWKDINESASPTYVFNIESGTFALNNQTPNAATYGRGNSSHIKSEASQSYSFTAGMGDGYYPVLPFFDNIGEFQSLIAFFTHVIDLEVIRERISFNYLTFAHRIPIKLGYIDCDGSLTFGDESVYTNHTDEVIIEYTNLPKEKYLVVAFIDSSDGEPSRVFELAVMRDRMKRNYEVLFELFPELTNRKDLV